MPISYWKADAEVCDLLATIMNEWHPDLVDADVKVGILFALHSDETKSSVSHGGYPALATIKIVSLRDRVTKGYDAEMLVDGSMWATHKSEHKVAILDHELTHINVKREKPKKGAKAGDAPPDFVLDDIGRPVLKLRKGDWNAGDGFKEVVQRHREFSAELLNINAVQAMINTAISEADAEIPAVATTLDSLATNPEAPINATEPEPARPDVGDQPSPEPDITGV